MRRQLRRAAWAGGLPGAVGEKTKMIDSLAIFLLESAFPCFRLLTPTSRVLGRLYGT
jgi:hypothetical protein